MREQFEKLPEIADSLSEHIYFGGDGFYHSSLVNFQGLVNWLNGAWYAFQEQQTKINAVLQYLDTGDHPLDFSANTIRELLK
ncbi:MAG: hypothetical protein RSE18_09615 [Acinetobacter sp.]